MTKRKLPKYEYDLENQALSFLRDYAILAFIFFLISHSLIAILIYQDFPSIWVIVWLFCFIVIQTLSLKFRRETPLKKITHEAKLSRGVIINIFDGFIAASCVIFFPYVHDITIMLVITFLLISCTGAILTTIGYSKFYFSYSVPVLAVIILASACTALLYNGSQKLLIVSIATLAIIYPLFNVSIALSRHFREAFSTNLKIKEINHQLNIAVQDSKRANESKTRFLASASHDLRQPINTLSLFVASLTLKDNNQEHAEIIGHMNTAISSIDAQLESLLDISKLDAGIVSVNEKECDVSSLVKGLCGTFENQVAERVSLRVQDITSNSILRTDIVLLERVLINLISNALKHTESGYIDITLKNNNDKIQISIKDTGTGIPAEELEKIFDEFYQVDNAERNAEKGLGLGLSIVKRLTSLLDIDLELTSQFGIGTKVILEIPIQDNFSEEYSISEHSHLQHDPKQYSKIMILDNEVGNVIAMESALTMMGFKADAFTDAKEALLASHENNFDLALIDFRLPGPLNGDDVISAMKKNNRNTKFFLLTGDSKVQENKSNYQVIHKPITGKKLEGIFD